MAQSVSWEREGMYQQRLWWLHFPKCGTSFATSVAPYQRAADRINSGMHPPLRGHTRLQDVIAIFRSPDDRLRSAHHWMQVRPKSKFTSPMVGDH